MDFSDPAVQEYVALVRLQVLTPLSLLVNIAVLAICATLTNPTLSDVAKLYPTAISPHPPTIAAYILFIFLGQLGYSILIVIASKQETKKAITKAVGISLVLANFVMAAWTVAFVFRWFIAATVLQGVLLALLVYSNVALLVYHQPTMRRPLDTVLIHAPVRFFLALPFSILFPYCLFIAIGLSFPQTSPPGHLPDNASWHPWAGFAALLSTNVVALIVILIRHDIVWCVAATWLCISLWIGGKDTGATPKPPQVYITAIVLTVLHPVALVVVIVWDRIYRKTAGRRSGAVQLPPGPDDALHREALDRQRNATAREVDEEQLWAQR